MKEDIIYSSISNVLLFFTTIVSDYDIAPNIITFFSKRLFWSIYTFLLETKKITKLKQYNPF